MALPLPPSSNLHAILLVTQSRSLGPRLVFHFPLLSPSAAALATNRAPEWFGNGTSTGSLDSNSSSSGWDSNSDHDVADEDGEGGSRASSRRGSGRTGTSYREREKQRPGGGNAWARPETFDEDDAGLDETGKPIAERKFGGDHDWNTVLGFKIDALEKMLCPNKAFNKRRFELGVESIVFLGAPMFVRDDGLWKKRRRKREKRSAKENLENGNLLANLHLIGSDDTQSKPGPQVNSPIPDDFVYPQGFEPGYGHGLMSGAASEAGSDARSTSTTDTVRDDMTMFNIVFVLNPPVLEYQTRIKDMYDNVTRKYAKALKYEQARFQYVWKESKKIINIKQRAKENGEPLSTTWREILYASPLAKSIAILFDAISNDKIAHIRFDPTFHTSFQIPQPDSTPYLPSAMEPQMPGLWLTTSNVVIEDDSAPMTQNAALLLLQDPETLVKELEGDAKGNTGPLAFYIRNIVPTKSLHKLSIKHNILATDMEYIASHLVYWRKARLIAPLHPRDTYIVSPNADLSNLQTAISVYAARFPTLPTLPKMLNMLSGTPRPYRALIPTNEHREAYMEILAWLMRGGWVTQLRTFAWVRVTSEIKAQVAQEKEREKQAKRAAEDARRDTDADSLTESIFSDKRSSLLAGRPGTPLRRSHRRDEEEDMEMARILSPRGYRDSPARPASDAGSTSSNRTTIPLAAARPASPAQVVHAQTKLHRPSPLHLKSHSPALAAQPFSPTSPSLSQTNGQNGAAPHSPPLPAVEGFTESLVLCPQKANSDEARWLEKIGASFEDKEIREHWGMLLKHFDGKHALEDMYCRENLKRKKVSALVGGVREKGWLVIVRHW